MDEKLGGIRCQKCPESTFENNEDFRKHYKSEWHLFNQTRLVKNETTLN